MIDPTGHEVQPPADEPEMEDSPDNVCELCFEDNLLSDTGIAECSRCKKAFCVHFASRIDSQYCEDCMQDVTVTKDKFTEERIYEKYDEVTEETRQYKRRKSCTRIKPGGQDWLFAQRKIPTLDDIELDLVIEYHRGMLQLLLTESEERKMAKAHRNAAVKVITTSTVTTTMSAVKATEVKAAKQKEKLQGIMQAFLDKGFTEAQIKTMLGIKA